MLVITWSSTSCEGRSSAGRWASRRTRGCPMCAGITEAAARRSLGALALRRSPGVTFCFAASEARPSQLLPLGRPDLQSRPRSARRSEPAQHISFCSIFDRCEWLPRRAHRGGEARHRIECDGRLARPGRPGPAESLWVESACRVHLGTIDSTHPAGSGRVWPPRRWLLCESWWCTHRPMDPPRK